jgi:hypothetical protein
VEETLWLMQQGELREEIAVVFTLQRMTLFMELYFMWVVLDGGEPD